MLPLKRKPRPYSPTNPIHLKRTSILCPSPRPRPTEPFPTFIRPTPKECRIIHDALLSHDGFPEEFAKYRAIRNRKSFKSESDDDDGEEEEEEGCDIGEMNVSEVVEGTVLDGLVGILLSQNTTEGNAKKAFTSLKLVFPTWDEVLTADTHILENAIKCGGLAVTKASCIKNLLSGLHERKGKLCLEYLRGKSIDEVKAELRGFKRIGPKTVACVLMFHLHLDDFPVDTHVFRIAKYMGWVPVDADREKTYHHLNKRIPDELKFNLNCLLVTHGKICPSCSKKLIDQDSNSSNAKSCPLSKAGTIVTS